MVFAGLRNSGLLGSGRVCEAPSGNCSLLRSVEYIVSLENAWYYHMQHDEHYHNITVKNG